MSEPFLMPLGFYLQKVYTNRCTFKTCKKKEMIPILCDTCNLNFCLKHRHPQDHECTKNCGKSLGKAGQAALARTAAASSSSSRNQQSIVTRVSNATSSAANGLSRAMGFRPAAVQGNLVIISINILYFNSVDFHYN